MSDRLPRYEGDVLVFTVRVKGIHSRLTPKELAWQLVAQHWAPTLWAQHGPEARIEIDETEPPCCDGRA